MKIKWKYVCSHSTDLFLCVLEMWFSTYQGKYTSVSFLVPFMHWVLQCVTKGLRTDGVENSLVFYNLCALPTFRCKNGRYTIRERETKGNLGFFGTVWFQLSLSCASYCPHLCLGVLPFEIVQARTTSQELLGLRKPILELSNCVFSSGICLQSGRDARHSEILFSPSSSPPAVFPSDICGTFPHNCERESTCRSDEKFVLWHLKGVWNQVLILTSPIYQIFKN